MSIIARIAEFICAVWIVFCAICGTWMMHTELMALDLGQAVSAFGTMGLIILMGIYHIIRPFRQRSQLKKTLTKRAYKRLEGSPFEGFLFGFCFFNILVIHMEINLLSHNL